MNKQIITTALILGLLLSLSFAVAQTDKGDAVVPLPACKGDFTGDGKVNKADLNPFRRFMQVHNAEQFETADMNSDGFVDARDHKLFIDTAREGVYCEPSIKL